MRGDERSVRPSRGTLWAALALIVITAIAFGPVLGHPFIESWDDSPAILANPNYNPPTLGKLAHYWVPPPTDTFYVPLTYTLWGLLAMASRSSAPPGLPFNPAFFYAANLAAHAISSSLVFVILVRLVLPGSRTLITARRPPLLPLPSGEGRGEGKPGKTFPGQERRSPSPLALTLFRREREEERHARRFGANPILAAWLGAAFFALHPVQVEGVATASSLYTPVSGLFGFLAIWQYLLFSDCLDDQPGQLQFARLHYALSTLAFVLALLTKPTAVAVPLMIAVIELTLRKRKLLTLVSALVPWLALSLLIIWINEHGAPTATVFVPEPQYRPLVPLDAIGFYVIKLFAPVRLASDYGRSPQWLVAHPLAWFTCLITIAIFAFAWRTRARIPWALAAFGVFVAGLLPSIGIVPFDFQHYSTVADRYLYLALLGPAIAATFLILRFRHIAAGLSIVALAVLTTLSIIQLSYWRDEWHLMAHTLDVNPQSASAVAGFRYLLTGRHDTRGFPAPRHCTLDSPTLVHTGDLLMSRHLWPVAAAAYRRAISRGIPTAPIYDRLGTALLRDLDPQSAREAFADAMRLDPNDPDAQRGLAKAAAMLEPAATAP
jgi:hypothetical protein